MTSDPEQLMEEFPYWLEKVSTKLPDGVVLVIDSGDRFQVNKWTFCVKLRLSSLIP